MTIQLNGLSLYLLVFVRFAGMIAFNPLLSRRNVPNNVRTIFALALTFVIAPTLDIGTVADFVGIDLAFSMVKELFVGFICGYAFQIFYEMLLFAGDMLDTEFGMSMAKIFDPGTNMQVSLTGKLLTFLFVGYFFATDSHLVMIHMFATTFSIIPPGTVTFTQDAMRYGMELFVNVFVLALRLVTPFMAAEFVLQAAMGVLMKLVPQIHVFVINFQLKQGLGLVLLFILAPVVGAFMDNYIVILLDSMQKAAEMLIIA
ncbi:MAG: flagellar biosynthetic protein FliR [Oscillospiraceae bacterium]